MTRYNEHMHSLRNKNLKESTKLSLFIHAAKFNEDMMKNSIKLNIVHKINQYKPSRICTLCKLKRLEIAFVNKKSTSELN